MTAYAVIAMAEYVVTAIFRQLKKRDAKIATCHRFELMHSCTLALGISHALTASKGTKVWAEICTAAGARLVNLNDVPAGCTRFGQPAFRTLPMAIVLAIEMTLSLKRVNGARADFSR